MKVTYAILVSFIGVSACWGQTVDSETAYAQLNNSISADAETMNIEIPSSCAPLIEKKAFDITTELAKMNEIKDKLLAAVQPVASPTCFKKSATVELLGKGDPFGEDLIQAEREKFKHDWRDYISPHTDLHMKELRNDYARQALSDPYLRGKKLKDIGVYVGDVYNIGFYERSSEIIGAELFVFFRSYFIVPLRTAIVLKLTYCED